MMSAAPMHQCLVSSQSVRVRESLVSELEESDKDVFCVVVLTELKAKTKEVSSARDVPPLVGS